MAMIHAWNVFNKYRAIKYLKLIKNVSHHKPGISSKNFIQEIKQHLLRSSRKARHKKTKNFFWAENLKKKFLRVEGEKGSKKDKNFF